MGELSLMLKKDTRLTQLYLTQSEKIFNITDGPSSTIHSRIRKLRTLSFVVHKHTDAEQNNKNVKK